MKIYAVKYSWDNGESYEDYRSYNSYSLFDTLKEAEKNYYLNVVEDYEGSFALIEWETGTQKKTVLDESPWYSCSPYNPSEDDDYEEYRYDPYDDYDWGYQYPDPRDSYKSYWECEDDCEVPAKSELAEIADTMANEFCDEYNLQNNDRAREDVIEEYDEFFKHLGYTQAWEAYKCRVIPSYKEDIEGLNALLDNLLKLK